MKLATFLFINFVVAFLSDVILNDLSTNSDFLHSLKPYFQDQSIIKSGLYAAITIEVALIITIVVFYALLGSFLPTNNTHLLYFCFIAFLVGYLMDVAIDKFRVFGNRLVLYYKEFGAGFWGAAAFLFSILASYFIQKQILPHL